MNARQNLIYINQVRLRFNTLSNFANHGIFQLGRVLGGGGIRTLETLTGLPVFKTGTFNRSATPPEKLRASPAGPSVADRGFR